MSADKVFLDTNILVYAYDSSASHKHEIAVKIVRDLWQTQNGILSTQVLQEFFVTVTRKIPEPLDLQKARSIITDLLQWEIADIDGESVIEAIDLHIRYQYSFWDAMIIGSAITCGASTLLTEDLASGQNIEGLSIINPFK